MNKDKTIHVSIEARSFSSLMIRSEAWGLVTSTVIIDNLVFCRWERRTRRAEAFPIDAPTLAFAGGHTFCTFCCNILKSSLDPLDELCAVNVLEMISSLEHILA